MIALFSVCSLATAPISGSVIWQVLNLPDHKVPQSIYKEAMMTSITMTIIFAVVAVI
jgi:hypothetical protein